MIVTQEIANVPWAARSNYSAQFPDGGHLRDFPQNPIGGPSGPGLWPNPIDRQIWNVDANLICRRVVGVYRTRGLRNGPGAQALIDYGGFYELAGSLVRRSDGVHLFTDGANNVIRSVVDDGLWTVGTFATGMSQCDTILFDKDENLWAFINYTGVYKLNGKTGAVLAFYPGPVRVYQGAACDNQNRIVVNTKQNSCSQLWEVNVVTGAFTLLAGIGEEDHDAEVAAGTDIVDGPALHAFIFTAGLVYADPAGAFFYFGAGDTANVRRYVRATGRVDTFHGDKLFHETQDLRGGVHTYIGFGYDAANDMPDKSTRAWYENIGIEGSSVYKKLVFVPDPPGGNVFKATFVNQIVPPTMETGAIVPIEQTYKNTGDQPWTVAGKFRLGSWNPQDNSTWKLPVDNCRVDLPNDVAPNASVTFKFNVKAPATEGTFNFQNKMMQDGPASWFGDATVNVAVVVKKPVTTDLPPIVNAGADQSIVLPSTASLTGTASDPEGKPVTVAWSKVSGIGSVNFSAPTALATQATFSAAGTYVLRLTASDGVNSASDDVTVNVAAVAPTPGATLTIDVVGTITMTQTGGTPGQPNAITSIVVNIKP